MNARKRLATWGLGLLSSLALPAFAWSYTCDVDWTDAEDHAASGDITLDVTAVNVSFDEAIGMVKTRYRVDNNGTDLYGPNTTGGAAVVSGHTTGVEWTLSGESPSATGWRCEYKLRFTPSGAGSSTVLHGSTFNSEYVIKVSGSTSTFGGAGLAVPSLDEEGVDYRGPEPWFATTAGSARPIVKAQLHATSSFIITDPPTLLDGVTAQIVDPLGNPIPAQIVEGTVSVAATGGWDGSNPGWLPGQPVPMHQVVSSLVAIVQLDVKQPVPN